MGTLIISFIELLFINFVVYLFGSLLAFDFNINHWIIFSDPELKIYWYICEIAGFVFLMIENDTK